jgi:hypothetical protein
MDDAVAADFGKCEPKYSQIPFFSLALRSIVAVGTFVAFDGGIYRIVSYDTKQKTVTLNLFTAFIGSGLTHNPIFSGAGREHVEVVQTLNCTTVCPSELSSVVFVLRPSDLQTGKYVGGDGMEDIFVVRFRNDGKGISKSFVPFPDDSPYYPVVESSYAYEVYKDLSRFADSAAAILTRAAESQGTLCTGRQHFDIHPRTWAYIKHKLGVETHPVEVTTHRKRTLAGMKTATYSQVHKCEYIRLQTEEHMDALVRTLGPTSVMGNRVKRPKIGFPHQAGTRSVLNQVNGTNNETDEGANFKRRTTDRGFDICSDGDIARLYVRYERHILGTDEPSAQLQACLHYNLLERDEVDELEFAHGTQFEYNEELYEIFAVSLERITGVPIGAEDENEAIYFIGDAEKQQLSDLIVAYN